MPVKPQKPSPTALSRQEMRTISQAINRNYAPKFFQPHARERQDIQFSSHELREISRQINRDYSHSSENYEPHLLLLSVAPDHLHVFWQLEKLLPTPAIDSTSKPVEQPQNALTLRIFPEASGEKSQASVVEQAKAIDIIIDSNHGHGEIHLPTPASERRQPVTYHATLGRTVEPEQFQPLLYSNSAESIVLPRAIKQQPSSLATQQSIMLLTSHSGSPTSGAHSGQGKLILE